MLYMKKNNKMLPLTGSTLYADTPIGTIQAFTGITAPQGYLIFDGREVSRTEYADLWKFANDNNQVGAGKFYGDGDGSTTFTLADLRETSLKGIGLTSRTVGAHIDADGLELGEFVDDRIQQHQHPNDLIVSPSTAGLNTGYSQGSKTGSTSSGGNANGRSGATTEVKAVGVNWIVKAKHVALPIDIMDGISEEYATKDYVTDATLGEVIWENPNPNSNFSGQTIVPTGVDLSQYKAISVYFKNATGGAYYNLMNVPKDLTITLRASASTLCYRNCIFTDSGITFAEGTTIATYGGSGSTNNGTTVPQKIYGLK